MVNFSMNSGFNNLKLKLKNYKVNETEFTTKLYEEYNKYKDMLNQYAEGSEAYQFAKENLSKIESLLANLQEQITGSEAYEQTEAQITEIFNSILDNANNTGGENTPTETPVESTPQPTTTESNEETIPETPEPVEEAPVESTPNTTTTVIDPTLAKNLDADLGAGFSAKVEEVAKNINCDPNDLLALMYSESGLNPKTTASSTGAVGLIQFMPSTANDLGYTTSEIKNMTPVEQLDLVEKYFKKTDYYMKGEKKSAADLYSICFLPGRADREVLTTKGESYYSYNSGLDLNKDGQITKSDLNNRLDKKYAEMEKEYRN